MILKEKLFELDSFQQRVSCAIIYNRWSSYSSGFHHRSCPVAVISVSLLWLKGLQLGDKTAFTTFNENERIEYRETNEVLKTQFLQRLPLSMQQILSVCDDGLYKLAQIADKIAETTASASINEEVLTRPSLGMLEAKVEKLTNQVQRLSWKLSRQL
ncbi:hypothetical protein AVEN_130325-1 [Araneus ventricosus]|uniref:Uncharacterized protein n=1 Tax=Araneus ventricosus TaxID=182803 RepID=A0A4Y2BDS8_ARAVE|nr:hypothetical protein AVEN_130325-1 [Araneus ventricosus]